ncbi:MAG TPA: alpha/beta hydrolase fold domain-containing protein [Jatrophihabitantaceae bacterium]
MKPRYLPRRLVRANAAAFYRVAFNPRVPIPVQRRLLETAARSQPLPHGTVVRRVMLGGRPADRITVGATVRRRTVLYLHGGGYTSGSPATHRSLAAFLAREAGAVVYTLAYRLAPEHAYPAALDDAVAAYLALDGPAVIAGDSAGGGLAAATAVRLRYQGVTPPGLVLLSPWTDPADDTMTRPRDMVVNVAQGRLSAAAYGGGVDPHDPGFAPMHADLAGLPPTLVHVAPGELLYEQVLRFVDRLRAAGVDVTLRELPELWHSGHAQAGILREARAAVAEVGAFVRSTLDGAVHRSHLGTGSTLSA